MQTDPMNHKAAYIIADILRRDHTEVIVHPVSATESIVILPYPERRRAA